MSNILRRKLLYKVHRYSEPDSIVLGKKTDRLAKEVWEPKASGDTMALKHVQSDKLASSNYSPSAQSKPVAWADVVLTGHMWQKQDSHKQTVLGLVVCSSAPIRSSLGTSLM